MCQARLLFWSSDNTGWPVGSTTWFWLVLATVLTVLAYCLYRAHNWARVTVIALGIFLFAAFLWSVVAAELNSAEMLRMDGRNGRQLWLDLLESALDDVGRQLSMLLAPVAFMIGVLCHRDVAAAFRRRAGNEI